MSRWPVVWLGLLGVYLLALAVTSLSRVMYQDAPIMLYSAFLVDRLQFVPYRDFFDNQMPGVYAVNIAIGRLSQYSELGVRWVDVGALALLLAVTFGILRRFGKLAGWCAAIYVGILYLASGEFLSLQREFLLLLPLSAATWVALARPVPHALKALIVGVLLGLVATIKPQATLAFAVLVASIAFAPGPHNAASGMHARHSRTKSRVAVVALAALGFVMPLIVMLEWLRRNGALTAFWDMAVHYWPLYNALSGSPRPHVILSGAARVWYVLGHSVTFGVHPGLPLLAAAVLGTWRVWPSSLAVPERRHSVITLVALAVASWLSVAVAGKFYAYHWLPFQYFAILLAAQGWPDSRVREHSPNSTAPSNAAARCRVPVAILVVLLTVGVPWRCGPFWRPFTFPFARVDAIATYLKTHLQPGDTVAPFDWTEGAAHAMLLAHAPLGVPFLYNFPLFHHVSSPYVRALRQRVLDRMNQSPPRFIVRVPQAPFAGPDTSATFEALDHLVETQYERDAVGEGYEIWRRRQP